jgi:hypothetical protein
MLEASGKSRSDVENSVNERQMRLAKAPSPCPLPEGEGFEEAPASTALPRAEGDAWDTSVAKQGKLFFICRI